jgi:hypothetical protein
MLSTPVLVARVPFVGKCLYSDIWGGYLLLAGLLNACQMISVSSADVVTVAANVCQCQQLLKLLPCVLL